MPFENLLPFISNMYEEMWEENLWEVWISNPFQDKGFDEFRKEAIANRNNAKSAEQKIAEAKEAERLVMQAFRKGG